MNVNLDLPGNNVAKYYTHVESYNLAAEVNARYLQENQKDDPSIQIYSHDHIRNSNIRTDQKENKIAGFLNIFGKKVKRFFSRIVSFIPRNK